jgi:hypothetical protein
MSTTYHPQIDGETEKANQELETYLQIYCGSNPTSWESMILVLKFTYNNHMHETIKQMPFFLMEGYEMKPFPLLFSEMPVPSVEQWIIQLQKARDEALAAHELAQQHVEPIT